MYEVPDHVWLYTNGIACHSPSCPASKFPLSWYVRVFRWLWLPGIHFLGWFKGGMLAGQSSLAILPMYKDKEGIPCVGRPVSDGPECWQ